MIGEDAHGLFARLRSSVTNKFTNWSKPAAILENDSDLTLDKVKQTLLKSLVFPVSSSYPLRATTTEKATSNPSPEF